MLDLLMRLGLIDILPIGRVGDQITTIEILHRSSHHCVIIYSSDPNIIDAGFVGRIVHDRGK